MNVIKRTCFAKEEQDNIVIIVLNTVCERMPTFCMYLNNQKEPRVMLFLLIVFRVHIHKEVISNLKRGNQFLTKEIWEFT